MFPSSRPLRRPPLTLIANSHEWHSRSLETILGPHGYAVLRAYTARQTLERAASSGPDLIIVDSDLPDRSGVDVVRELRTLREVKEWTPILMTSAEPVSRQRRMDALRAGAWDFLGTSLDAEEVTLKLDALVRAKQEVDHARDESLLDEITGLYNLRGLARRAREVSSHAFRHKEPLSCVVLSPITEQGQAMVPEHLVEALAQALQATGRHSDAIGMVGPNELAVIAVGTDASGVERLAERVAEAFARTFGNDGVRIAVGYDSIANYADSPTDPSDLITHASTAMREAMRGRPGARRFAMKRFETAVLN
jgi:diguanylate cyclase (GGDEF)-like protein